MKKILKKEVIIAFIVGVLIASGITVYATSYFAQDISYTDKKSVAKALDELYSLKTSSVQDLIDSNIDNKSSELDYDNLVDISSNLSSVNNTYTFLKNGQLIVQMGIDAGGYYYSTIKHNNTDMNWVRFHNSSTGGAQYSDHTLVNKNDTITVTHISNVQADKHIFFIPFK